MQREVRDPDEDLDVAQGKGSGAAIYSLDQAIRFEFTIDGILAENVFPILFIVTSNPR